MVFKFAYFVELKIGYQPAKFLCCRLPESSFTEGLQKHNDDVISYCWDSKFCISCEIEHRLLTCQVSNLSDVKIKF